MEYSVDSLGKMSDTLKTKKKYMRDEIYKRANMFPLLSLLKKKNRVMKETHKKFEYVTVKFPTVKFRIENVNDSDTTLTVKTDDADVKFLQVGDIIKGINTNEQMRIESITGKTLTVSRGYAEKSVKVAVTGDANNEFINLGRAFEEGSTMPNTSKLLRGEEYNYCQTFRHGVKITRNKLREGGYGDNGTTAEQRRKFERQLCLNTHLQFVEHTLMFGSRQKSVYNDEDLYVTGGICSLIQSNIDVITDPNQFTVSRINKMLGRMADAGYGAGGDKVLLYGSGFSAKLNDNAVKVFGGGSGAVIENEVGIALNRVITEYGKVDMIYSPVLSNVYNNVAVILDLSTMYLHEIDESVLKTNQESNAFDGVVDLFLTDVGLEMFSEASCGIIHLNF